MRIGGHTIISTIKCCFISMREKEDRIVFGNCNDSDYFNV